MFVFPIILTLSLDRGRISESFVRKECSMGLVIHVSCTNFRKLASDKELRPPRRQNMWQIWRRWCSDFVTKFGRFFVRWLPPKCTVSSQKVVEVITWASYTWYRRFWHFRGVLTKRRFLLEPLWWRNLWLRGSGTPQKGQNIDIARDRVIRTRWTNHA